MDTSVDQQAPTVDFFKVVNFLKAKLDTVIKNDGRGPGFPLIYRAFSTVLLSVKPQSTQRPSI